MVKKQQHEKDLFKSGAIKKVTSFIPSRRKFTLGDVVRKSRRRGRIVMEASERIVEAYMRLVKKCLTITNIKCKNNKEIDLLAVDNKNNRFHIETTISTSKMFEKLTDMDISKELSKRHPGIKARYRRTINYFITDKFNNPEIIEGLKVYGFEGNNYKKIIISRGAKDDAKVKAQKNGIEIWDFHGMLTELFKATAKSGYLTDEARIFQLINFWMDTQHENNAPKDIRKSTKKWHPHKGIGKLVYDVFEKDENIDCETMKKEVLENFPKSKFIKNPKAHFAWYKTRYCQSRTKA